MNSTKQESKPHSENRSLLSRLSWRSYLAVAALLVVSIVASRWLFPSTDAGQVHVPEVTERQSNHPDPEADASPESKPTLAQLSISELAELPLPERINLEVIDQAEHPFDPLLRVAESCLLNIDQNIKDYTAEMTSQVRIDGKLLPPKKMHTKIRHPSDDPSDKVPFSVYTRFLEPESNAGQEAIWVKDWNKGNIVAHLSGFANLKRFYIAPDSSHAMDGNRYPISEIGVRNLLVKMSEVGQHDRDFGECVVTIKKGLELGGRPCTMLEAMHPQQREHFEFHLARIYIDDEWDIPIGYEGYLWPETEDGEPVLLEKYFYTDVQLNVGLKDIDFDPANENYQYPSW